METLTLNHLMRSTVKFQIRLLFSFTNHLKGINTPSGKGTLSNWFCLPSEKGSTLKQNNICSKGEQILYILEWGVVVQESKQEVTKAISLVQNGGKVYPILLKPVC